MNTRSGFGTTARARIVPVRGSTWLSMKSSVPACGKPVSFARPTRTGLRDAVALAAGARARRSAGRSARRVEVDVHGVERDQRRQQRRVGLRQVADRHQGAAGAAVDRRTHLGELEVEPRAVDRGLGGAHRALPWRGRRLAGVELLARDRLRVDQRLRARCPACARASPRCGRVRAPPAPDRARPGSGAGRSRTAGRPCDLLAFLDRRRARRSR